MDYNESLRKRATLRYHIYLLFVSSDNQQNALLFIIDFQSYSLLNASLGFHARR